MPRKASLKQPKQCKHCKAKYPYSVLVVNSSHCDKCTRKLELELTKLRDSTIRDLESLDLGDLLIIADDLREQFVEILRRYNIDSDSDAQDILNS